jgi:hypothetical protein
MPHILNIWVSEYYFPLEVMIAGSTFIISGSLLIEIIQSAD